MKAGVEMNSPAPRQRKNCAGVWAGEKRGGIKIDPAATPAAAGASEATPDAQQTLTTLENSLLSGDISKQTHDTISKQLEDPKISQRRLDDPRRPPNVAAITGLILGSPEFQRR